LGVERRWMRVGWQMERETGMWRGERGRVQRVVGVVRLSGGGVWVGRLRGLGGGRALEGRVVEIAARMDRESRLLDGDSIMLGAALGISNNDELEGDMKLRLLLGLIDCGKAADLRRWYPAWSASTVV